MSCGVQALLGKVARERGPVLKRPDLPMSQAHPSALGGAKPQNCQCGLVLSLPKTWAISQKKSGERSVQLCDRPVMF